MTNNLPELPKQIKKKEAAFGLRFRKWIEKNPQMSGAFELKQVEGNSMPFSAVKPHQLVALFMASRNGILYKIADDSRGTKPFDYVYLRHSGAYVVIKYPDVFVLIEVRAFMDESETSVRRSLTRDRAVEISTTCVDL